MAKGQVETSDRFSVGFEIPRDLLGAVLADLARMGITQVSYELITDVHSYKKKRTFDVRAEDFAMEWIESNPTFRAKDAVAHFVENGRTNASAYTALRVLVEKKVLRSLGDGNYQRTDVRATESPVTKIGNPRQRSAGERNRRPYKVPNVDFMFKIIGKKKQFKTTDMQKAFKADRRNWKSVSPLIVRLVGDKLLKKIEPGIYAPLKRKPKPSKGKARMAPVKANGAAHPAAESTING